MNAQSTIKLTRVVNDEARLTRNMAALATS